MSVKQIELTESEREQLRTIIKKGSDSRERAKTILMLSEGQAVLAIAEKKGVMQEAIRERRRKWLKMGYQTFPINGEAVRPAN